MEMKAEIKMSFLENRTTDQPLANLIRWFCGFYHSFKKQVILMFQCTRTDGNLSSLVQTESRARWFKLDKDGHKKKILDQSHDRYKDSIHNSNRDHKSLFRNNCVGKIHWVLTPCYKHSSSALLVLLHLRFTSRLLTWKSKRTKTQRGELMTSLRLCS